MSVDPTQMPAYQYPADDGGGPSQFPIFEDRGFEAPQNRNPDGAEIGPLYVSPEGKRWIQENVFDQGLTIDWGTREIYDGETGEVKGTVPMSVPRMI